MPDVPLFSLAYTSVRPKSIPEVVNLWNSRSALKAHEWVISVDEGDAQSLVAAKSTEKTVEAKECGAVKVVVNTGSKDCNSGWNCAAAATTGKVIICVADDFLPPAGWDELLLGLEPKGWENGEYVVKVADGYVGDIFVLSILTRKRYERFGYVFYGLYRCLPGSARVYMADQTFKPISEVRAGELVVGSEHAVGKFSIKRQKRSKLCVSEVKAVKEWKAPVVKVTLQSGRVLLCTEDHLWAYYCNKRNVLAGPKGSGHGLCLKNGLIEVRNGFAYGKAIPGRKLVHVVDPPELPPEDTAWLRGWLAGFYDGEGCFPSFSQSPTKNPETCAHLRLALKTLGFSFSENPYTAHGFQQVNFVIQGGRREYLRFFNWVKPVKWFRQRAVRRMMTSRFGEPDEILAVEPTGRCSVYCIETTTGNFIADGYLSSNSMFNDTEFGEVAQRDGVTIDANHLLFEHLHPDCGKRARDNVDLVHASKERWKASEMLYNFRKARGFPLDWGPMAKKECSESETTGKEQYVAYMQVIKDDFCLLEVCRRLIEEGVKDFCFAQPDKYWSGEAIEPEHSEEIQQVIKALQGEGVTVHHQLFHVEQFKMPGDSRIQVETRVRNASVSWIRKLGYKHILIVDGDELWVKGTLDIIQTYVDQGHSVISCSMIPVIGVPGYPIDFATDLAVVYIGDKETFKSCRSPFTPQTRIPRQLVYHFTGTRRSMDDTIKKHRRGGHYDDPEYHVEEWLEKVLPNIKPGFSHTWPSGHSGAHFYGPYQIWPKIRDWRPGEIESMPKSIQAYLPAPVS